MSAIMPSADSIGCCILATLLMLMLLPANGLNCMRTESSRQPVSRDCGPKAQGCRILIYPYRHYNDSAVGLCRNDLKQGEFIYDCAVDCPARNNLDWNELVCCKGDNCNSNLEDVIKKNYCYVSKTDGKERDNVVICKKYERCAVNVVTRDTQCVDESECTDKEKWSCCTSTDNCGNTAGVTKLERITEDASTDASNITASLFMSVAFVIAFCITVS